MTADNDNINPQQFLVPQYANLSDKDKPRINAIIQAHRMENPNDAFEFGSKIMSQNQSVSTKIVQAMQADEHSVMSEPLRAGVEALQEMDLQGLQQSVSHIIEKGSALGKSGMRYAQKNPKTSAVIAAGVLSGQFWLSAAAGGFTGVRQYIKNKKIKKWACKVPIWTQFVSILKQRTLRRASA